MILLLPFFKIVYLDRLFCYEKISDHTAAGDSFPELL